MKIDEIIRESLIYFGKDRRHLKKLLSGYEFTGKEYRAWKRTLQSFSSKPFDVSYGVFSDVADALIEKRYSEIDWKWLGDLSWEIRFVLNPDIDGVYDFDARLASKCGGTARILQIYASDIIPTFVVNSYYMMHDRKQNFWEYGPLRFTSQEKIFLTEIKRRLTGIGYTFLSKPTAMKTFPELYSDLNEGGASLFDVLFTDTNTYQTDTVRFNNKRIELKDGKVVSWDEEYDKSHRLLKRKEFTFYPSGNVACIITDKLGQITEVKVWRDIAKLKHHEFRLDIWAEYKKIKVTKRERKKTA